MKIGIVGSRNFSSMGLLNECLWNLTFKEEKKQLWTLVSGGARGVDKYAENWAIKHKLPVKIFRPDWKKYGLKAGAIRNNKIVREADIIYAFWDGKSRGTKITIDMAISAGKPINIYVRS